MSRKGGEETNPKDQGAPGRKSSKNETKENATPPTKDEITARIERALHAMVPRPDQIPDAHESYLKFRAKMRRKHGLPSVPRDVESGGELLDEVLEPDPSPEKGADSEVKKKEEA